MTAPPYMRLNIGDYDADTRHLTTLEDGAYWRLIRAMWRAGGALPANDGQLAKLAGVTPEEWAAMRPTIRAFFVREGRRLTQKRVARELAHVRNVSEQRSQAAKTGVEKKRRKTNDVGSANAEQMLSKSTHIKDSLEGTNSKFLHREGDPSRFCDLGANARVARTPCANDPDDPWIASQIARWSAIEAAE